MKKGKIWGTTDLLFCNDNTAIHILNIEKGGYCSKHRHGSKSNTFYIISGNLKLIIWTSEGVKDETVLWQGEQTEIQPGVYHQFKALTSVVCLEVYEVKFHGDDIERESIGGIDKAK